MIYSDELTAAIDRYIELDDKVDAGLALTEREVGDMYEAEQTISRLLRLLYEEDEA